MVGRAVAQMPRLRLLALTVFRNANICQYLVFHNVDPKPLLTVCSVTLFKLEERVVKTWEESVWQSFRAQLRTEYLTDPERNKASIDYLSIPDLQ